MYLLLVVPFFCGATCVGLAFVCYGDKIGRIYAFNLIGSAAGALGIVAVLFVLVPSDALRLIADHGVYRGRTGCAEQKVGFLAGAVCGATILALTVWVALPDAWFALRISDYKALPGALNVLGAKVLSERSGPLGLLAVVESPNVPFRYVPGLSLNAPMTPPEQLGVFFDGNSMTAITRFDGRREELAYLDYTTDALAYPSPGKPRVLVLGAGGGSSVLQGLYHQAAWIDVVELDSNMVRLLGKDYAQYAGTFTAGPTFECTRPKHGALSAQASDTWDVVQIPLLDAFGAGSGIHGLSETYIYTVEAFRAVPSAPAPWRLAQHHPLAQAAAARCAEAVRHRS